MKIFYYPCPGLDLLIGVTSKVDRNDIKIDDFRQREGSLSLFS